MKKGGLLLVLFILAILIYGCDVGLPIVDIKEPSTPDSNVSINGTGEVNISPDNISFIESNQTLNVSSLLEDKKKVPLIEQEIFEKLKKEYFLDINIIVKGSLDLSDIQGSLWKIEENKINVLKTLNNRDFSAYEIIPDSNILLIRIHRSGVDKLKNNTLIMEMKIPKKASIHLVQSLALLGVRKNGIDILIPGMGENVCIVDTGIDSEHLNFNGRIYSQKCYCRGQVPFDGLGCCPSGGEQEENASDDNGHGTHVAGILASNDSTYGGISPTSKIAVVKVCDKTGKDCDDNDIIQAISWCRTQNISSISGSLGRGNFGTTDCPIDASNTLTLAKALNITATFSSGNGGNKSGINWPSCDPIALSIGATYDQDLGRRPAGGADYQESGCHDDNAEEDNIPCFSNSDSTLDLLAPGADILSTRKGGGPPELMFGTSQAAPHVSGAVLLLQQFNKQSYGKALTPDEIFHTLNKTGVPILDSRNNLTFSRIDIVGAISSLTTHKLNDEISASLRKGQTWYTKLNLTNIIGYDITIRLTELNEPHNLSLTLISPNGTSYDGIEINKFMEEVKLTSSNILQGNNWTIKVQAVLVPIREESKFKVEAINKDGKNPEEKTGGGPGGINFTEINLQYISTCNAQNGIEVVMKGTEANTSTGDTLLNISNATTIATDAFLTGLIIPNYKQIVSMYPIGSVQIDDTFSQTETARILLDADAKLKFTFYNDTTAKNQYKAIVEYLWSNILNNSPYYNDLKNSGWDGYPYWIARQWISPRTLTANGTGCKIYLTNATLKVDTELKSSWVNLYEFNLPQAAISDVEERLRTWAQTNLTNWLTNNSARAEIEINNHSKYSDLRRVYASLALAQWYKSQDKNGLVFSELIDSNNITGINISFNKAYWESQSNQRLTEDIYHGSCFKTDWQSCYSYIYGGVDFKDSKPPTNGSITNGTSDSMAYSLITSYVKDGKIYYYSTAIDVEKPNLNPVAMGFSSLSPEPNQTVNITVAVENDGNLNAGNFTVYFYSTFTYPTGEIVKERISIVNMSSAGVDEFALANATWETPAALGNYNITAVVDYYNAISEANELDNTLTEVVAIFTNFPTATITSPAHNKVSCGDVTLTGSGTDPQDGSLNNTLLNWTSHLQGYLGNGTSRTINLSLGVHDITLKATDSQGFSDNETITLNIIPCNPPSPVLLSPSDKTYAEGELIYFNGYALDQEDGAIPNASLVWNSSADGTLNTGSSFFSTRALSVGNHTITLKAIDVTEQIGLAQVNITVEEGTPSISILSPANGKEISYKATTNFIGNATDPQDGNISNSIVWVSGINGTLGTGGSLNANLSVGTHTVTATVTDSHANTVSASISAEVKPPQYPVASIISPRNTQQFTHGDNITFWSSYSDFEDGTLTNASLIWKSSIDGIFGNGTLFTRYNFSIGNHTFYFNVTDLDNYSSAASVNATINPAPPVPTIYSPAAGSIFAQIDSIIFNGTAADYEDGTLSGNSLNWTSSKNGFLGTGPFLNLTNLSMGTHLITLNANDSTSRVGTSSLNIIVVGKSNVLVNKLADGLLRKNVTFSIGGNKTEYVAIPRTSNVTYAAINVKGYSP